MVGWWPLEGPNSTDEEEERCAARLWSSSTSWLDRGGRRRLNVWFLEPVDQKVPGSAETVEWLGEAFVVFRWTMGGDVGPATSEMVLVLGRSDARDAYTALYHDERGVCRVYAMTFDGSRWILIREDPDMFQRFIADVGSDRIAGRWGGLRGSRNNMAQGFRPRLRAGVTTLRASL